MLDVHNGRDVDGTDQQGYVVYEEDGTGTKEEEIPSLDLVSYNEAPHVRIQQPFPASNFSIPGEDGARQVARLQARLNQRLGPEYVSTRAGPGGGPKVFYLEGWKAIDLANEVFGFNGWSSSIVSFDVDYCDQTESGRYNIGLSATVRVTLRDGTFHEDVGYGTMDNAMKKGQGMEKAKKEAITDALKRALRNFGRSLGNCLYDKKFCEQVSRMKAQPAKYDMDEMKRPEATKPFQHEGEANNFKTNAQSDQRPRTNGIQRSPALSKAVDQGVASSSSSSSTIVGQGIVSPAKRKEVLQQPARPSVLPSEKPHIASTMMQRAPSPAKITGRSPSKTHTSFKATMVSTAEDGARIERLRQAAERKAALQRKCTTVEDEFSGDLIDMSASQLNRIEAHGDPHGYHDVKKEPLQATSPLHNNRHSYSAGRSSEQYHQQYDSIYDTRAKRSRY